MCEGRTKILVENTCKPGKVDDYFASTNQKKGPGPAPQSKPSMAEGKRWRGVKQSTAFPPLRSRYF